MNYYSTFVNIRQSGNTAANSTVFAMRASPSHIRKIEIQKIELVASFDDATPLARSLMRYSLTRFSAATPTGGIVINAAEMDTNNPVTNVSDIRYLDTGLTTTNVVFHNPFAVIGVPAVSGTVTYFKWNERFNILPGQGLCIRLLVQANLGQGLTGMIFWREV